MYELQQIGEQLIPAVAYADSAGLPVETMSHEKIQRLYGQVGRLLVTSSNEYFSGDHAPGTWSDDTQLTIAVAQGLIIADGFDINSQAETHVVAMNQTPLVEFKGKLKPRGWGGSTVNSVRRVMEGTPPLEAGEVGGVGNGILMKLAPLSYWHHVRGTTDAERYQDCDQLTLMTHNSPIAVACTRVHSDTLQFLLQNEQVSTQEFAIQVIGSAIRHENLLGLSSGELSHLFSYINTTHPVTEVDILVNTDGKGFYAPQTLAMAYGSFVTYKGDYAHAVYGAVNLGGDTDSIASIVGTMELFFDKSIVMPTDYDLIQDYVKLENSSRLFTKRAISQM